MHINVFFISLFNFRKFEFGEFDNTSNGAQKGEDFSMFIFNVIQLYSSLATNDLFF